MGVIGVTEQILSKARPAFPSPALEDCESKSRSAFLLTPLFIQPHHPQTATELAALWVFLLLKPEEQLGILNNYFCDDSDIQTILRP